MEVKVRLTEALDLIPDFSGENDEIEFVYFREGCRNALRVFDSRNKEDLLLTFLKNKLKGNAFMRFSLKLTSYASISEFLKDVKAVYASECDNTEFWINRIAWVYQSQNESMQKYSVKFQELLECAVIGIKYGEVERNHLIDEKKKKEEIKKLEGVTTSYFLANMLSGKTKRALKRYSCQLSSKNFMEIVSVAIKFSEYERIFARGQSFCPKSNDNSFDLNCSNFMKCCNLCETDKHVTDDCPEIKRDSINKTENGYPLSDPYTAYDDSNDDGDGIYHTNCDDYDDDWD